LSGGKDETESDWRWAKGAGVVNVREKKKRRLAGAERDVERKSQIRKGKGAGPSKARRIWPGPQRAFRPMGFRPDGLRRLIGGGCTEGCHAEKQKRGW